MMNSTQLLMLSSCLPVSIIQAPDSSISTQKERNSDTFISSQAGLCKDSTLL